QYHSRTAAVRHVVHHAMTIRREGAQIVHDRLDHASLDRASDDTGSQRVFDHRRKDRDDVEPHQVFRSSSPSGGATPMRRAATPPTGQTPPAIGTSTVPRGVPTTRRLPPISPSTAVTTPTGVPSTVLTEQPTSS